MKYNLFFFAFVVGAFVGFGTLHACVDDSYTAYCASGGCTYVQNEGVISGADKQFNRSTQWSAWQNSAR